MRWGMRALGSGGRERLEKKDQKDQMTYIYNAHERSVKKRPEEKKGVSAVATGRKSPSEEKRKGENLSTWERIPGEASHQKAGEGEEGIPGQKAAREKKM